MPQTWRDLLGELIKAPSERERLAHELGVHPWTPWRWIEDKTQPRAKHLKKIPDLFPKEKVKLLQLLRKEYPGLFPEPEERRKERSLTQIPSVYYSRLLSALSSDATFSSETIYHLGLFQLASQLVPIGETNIYVMSLSPSKRSLYSVAVMTYGQKDVQVHPSSFLASRLLFAGFESTAGVAVTRKQLVQRNSELALPLLRRSKVAGCLWIIPTVEQEWTQPKRDLLILYGELLTIAFEESQSVAQAKLVQVPDLNTQQRILAPYRMCSLNSQLVQELEDLLLGKEDLP